MYCSVRILPRWFVSWRGVRLPCFGIRGLRVDIGLAGESAFVRLWRPSRRIRRKRVILVGELLKGAMWRET